MARPLCVLLIEDSATVRRYLRDTIDADEGLHVVGEAADGEEGVRLARTLRPDVIILDIDLPRLDGIEATRRIMAEQPAPILVFCARSDDTARRAFQALAAGAMALIEKPRGSSGHTPEEVGREILSKVRVLAGVRAARGPRQDGPGHRPGAACPAPAPPGPARVGLVALAASTGGPAALGHILRLLTGLRLPLLIAQHMTPGFTDGLARWLSEETPVSVRVVHGEVRPEGGRAYVAADGSDLSLSTAGLLRSTAPADPSCVRPSADLLFSSVAEAVGPRALAVVLTGMGHDGTAGLRQLRARGGRVLVQDPASCVVQGMPRSAIEAGLADEVLSLDALASRIARDACGR